MKANKIDVKLMHHWSFDNGQMKDRISSAHMSQGHLTAFTNDLYGNEISAFSLNRLAGLKFQVDSTLIHLNLRFRRGFYLKMLGTMQGLLISGMVQIRIT